VSVIHIGITLDSSLQWIIAVSPADIGDCVADLLYRWREARERVNDRKLAPRRKLIMDEVHRPGLVRSCGRLPILAQLCLDPALRRLVAQLQAHLAVQPLDPLRIDPPPFPKQQHMDTTIALAHPGVGDLPDAFDQTGVQPLVSAAD
jgi:hypothetical protein